MIFLTEHGGASLEIRYLQTFLTVVEESNLTIAAEKLNYSQPNVSMHLKHLQKEIGVPLFIIKGNKRYLTPAGQVVQKYSERILQQLNQMQSEINELGECITITAPDFFCAYYLPKVMKKYKQNYPQLSVKIVSGNSDKTFQKVIDQETDLGIVIGKKIPSHLYSLTIGYDDLVMICSKELADQYSFQKLLQTYPVFVDEQVEFVQHTLGDITKQWNIISCTSEEMIAQAVVNQEGIGILGYQRIKKQIERNQVAILETYAKNVDVQLICSKERLGAPEIAAFYDTIETTTFE